jgi:hypothetical protein
MMRPSRETAECLLTYAHALRLHVHRSRAFTDHDRRRLDACIGRFEASVLLAAPRSVIGECGARLDEHISLLQARLPLRESHSARAGATSASWASGL